VKELIADYHIHLERGPYELNWLAQFAEQARTAGLDEIGITEHTHRFTGYRPVMEDILSDTGTALRVSEWLAGEFRLRREDFASLVAAGQDLGWPLKLGIEADFVPGKENETARWLQSTDWDYVLGSVHFLGTWGFDFSPESGWHEADVDQVYHTYFQHLQAAARSHLFDVLAHPDLVKIFGFFPQSDITGLVEETLGVIAGSGICIEVSSAGLRKPVGEIYPARSFLEAANRRDIPITLASDAHEPGDVGRDFDDLISYVRSCGYDRTAIFSHRQYSLEELG